MSCVDSRVRELRRGFVGKHGVMLARFHRRGRWLWARCTCSLVVDGLGRRGCSRRFGCESQQAA